MATDDKKEPVDAHIDRSMEFLAKMELDNAWKEIIVAEKICSNDPEALHTILLHKGLNRSKRERYDEAREFYNEGWKLAKGHKNECLFPYNISADYEDMGDFGRATKFLRDAKELGWSPETYESI